MSLALIRLIVGMLPKWFSQKFWIDSHGHLMGFV